MGSLGSYIAQTSRGNEEELRQAELLRFLLAAARSKIELLRKESVEEVNGSGSTPTQLPPAIRWISAIDRYHLAEKVRFDDQVAAHISSAIESIFPTGGDPRRQLIQDGLRLFIQSGLCADIGKSPDAEATNRLELLLPDHDALVRVDILSWNYRLALQSLPEGNDMVVAYLLIKSAIDPAQLRLDDFSKYVQATISSRLGSGSTTRSGADAQAAVGAYLQEIGRCRNKR